MKNLRRTISIILCLILALGNLHIVQADVPGIAMQETEQIMTASSSASEEDSAVTDQEYFEETGTIDVGNEDTEVVIVDGDADETIIENENYDEANAEETNTET